MGVRVNIKPQWRKLADWYWDSCEGKEVQDRGMSIWEMLAQNYGAQKGYTSMDLTYGAGMWVVFPDEQSYTSFLLKWQ